MLHQQKFDSMIPDQCHIPETAARYQRWRAELVERATQIRGDLISDRVILREAKDLAFCRQTAGSSAMLRSARNDKRVYETTSIPLFLILFFAVVLFSPFTLALLAQTQSTISSSEPATNQGGAQVTSPPIAITLAEAEQRARKLEPTLQAALAARGTAATNRVLARSALLPQGAIIGQYLFTESNGRDFGGVEPGTPGPVFIANNAVHEYTSQAEATETVSVAGFARYRQTSALVLQAQAQAEIAVRGLHVVVTQAYYSAQAASRKMEAAQDARRAAQNFLDLTEKLEQAREVAHADVLKARLQSAQAQRAVADAELLDSEARESLGVFLFPNPATPYTLADPLDAQNGSSIQIPNESDVRALAGKSNPALRSALEALKAADADVAASRAGYLPTLSFAYNYGLDAPQLAKTGSQGQRFLGYSTFAAINIPVWDWFATHARIQQSEMVRTQTRMVLDYAQRQLIADLNASYGELKTSAANLLSLEQSAADARQSLHLTLLQYRAGQALALEVVNAESAEVTAESALADGAVRYHVARANLERLTGTLP
jgi:outer membrane protein TolC